MNQPESEAKNRFLHALRLTVRWGLIFLYYLFCIVAIGTATAVLVFITLGKLYYPDGSYKDLALGGLKVGLILSGIWGIGVAIVKCFVRGKTERDAAQ